MSPFILDIVIAAVAGSVAGTLASLIAPWAKWGVEKRKRKLEWRKRFIDNCKQTIEPSYFRHKSFRETHNYSTLKYHLSDKLQKDIEGDSIHTQVGGGRGSENPIRKRLLDEINILEKEWGLI